MPGWRARPGWGAHPGIRRVAALLALAALAGCGGSAGPSAGGTTVANGAKITIMVRSLPAVGTVLVTSGGYALYMFQPDNRRAVTCSAVCAATWPPLKLPSGTTLVAGSGIKQSLLGTDPDPGGGRVVTYDGWPLYTYTGDVQPGQATGQAIDLNGGDWYVLSPSGTPVIAEP
jgi:predicted lipoprotein with Yx(FWY)xxD motif